MASKEILITGASGFVGQNLMAHLKNKNYNIQAFDRAGFKAKGVIIPKDCSGIVHLAGKAHDLKNSSNPDEYYTVNYLLTKQLYNAFLSSDATKFIFISSVKAAADSIPGKLTEDIIPDPKTDYGKSKLMAEQYIQSQPLPEGKSYYILRPCMIHGPGNKGNLNLLYQVVNKGIPYPLAAFENKRSFLSIENLCFVIEQLLESAISSGVYNIADDIPLSTNEVVQLLTSLKHKQAKLWRISPGLIRWLAKLGDKLHLPFTSERLQKLTESYIVDNTKLKNAINLELPVNSRDGLLRTATSFK